MVPLPPTAPRRRRPMVCCLGQRSCRPLRGPVVYFRLRQAAYDAGFFGDDTLVERAIITLAGNRGLLLVGEPRTAKSMLSELLAAAISGTSLNTIQGTAGTT